MNKEKKEKGIEELYNYLIKNKDKISKEEFEDLKKDFEKSLFKLYSEKSISKEFFENYSQKIKEMEGKEIKEGRPLSKKQWPLVIGLIAIICVVAIVGEHFLNPEGKSYTPTETSVSSTDISNLLNWHIVETKDISYPGKSRIVFRVQVYVDAIPTREQLKTAAIAIWKNRGQDFDELTIFMYLPDMNTNSVAYAVAQFEPEGLKDFEINEYALYGTKWGKSNTTTKAPITTSFPTSTPKPPRFIIEDIIVPLEIEEGEKTILSVIVKNKGGDGEDDITIWIGDEKVVRNVYIPENGTETIEVTFDVELPDIFRYTGLEIIVKSGSISKTIKVSPKTTITTVPLTTTPKPTTPKPKTWHTVETFSGTGDRTTHWFSIKGDEWRVKYKFSSSSSSCPFYAFIYPKGETEMYTAAWDCTGHCDDTTYIYSGKGEYYFNIITTSWGKWELTVEDYY